MGLVSLAKEPKFNFGSPSVMVVPSNLSMIRGALTKLVKTKEEAFGVLEEVFSMVLGSLKIND